MINDMAQLWGLPPYIALEGTPASLEEAQVRFMEVLSLPFLDVVLFKLVFNLTCVFFEGRVRLFACRLCVRFLPSVCPRQSCFLSASASRTIRKSWLRIRSVPERTSVEFRSRIEK